MKVYFSNKLRKKRQQNCCPSNPKSDVQNMVILAKLATRSSEITQNVPMEYIVTFRHTRLFSCKCHS